MTRPRPRLSPHAPRGGRSNTIGASERDLEALISSFESAPTPQGGAIKRLHARWPFAQTGVVAKLTHPGGTEISLTFACRNLSRTGIGLLHNTFVHPGSRLEVDLPRADGSLQRVRGVVARCEHRQGVIHEIGVKFDKEIALPEFIRPDIFEGWLTFESIEPAKVTGAVVHADPSRMDQKIVSHYLRDTGVSLRQVDSGAQALASMGSGCDLIVAECALPDMTGVELVQKLRASGNMTPVLLVSADAGPEERAAMARAGVDGFLRKPFESAPFLLGLAEFLVAEAQTRRSIPQGEGAHQTRLRGLAGDLDRLVAENRSIEAYVVCQQIKSVAPELGFDAIAKRASWVADKLAAGHQAAALADACRELTKACRDLRPAA